MTIRTTSRWPSKRKQHLPLKRCTAGTSSFRWPWSPDKERRYLSDIVAFIVERTKGDPAETSDINALRLELQESRRNEFNTCAQLAERDVLLHKLKETLQREYWDEYAGLDQTRALIDAALSASVGRSAHKVESAPAASA